MNRILFIAGLFFASTACSSSRSSSVSGDLLSYQDFDLETVVALIKDGKHVTDLASLEKQINTPATGINNVDVDKDGKVDHVAVQDKPGGEINLEFVAIPSSTPDDQSSWTTVAEVSIDKSAGDKVTIEGGYPDYVAGHSSHYYHSSSNGLLTGMLIGYMLAPSYGGYYHNDWGYYNSRYYGGSYSSRSYPVRPSSSVRSSRSSYRSSAGVSTASVKPAAKPRAYTVSSPRTKSTTVSTHKASVSSSRSRPSSSSSSSRSTPSSSGSVRSSPSRSSSRGGK